MRDGVAVAACAPSVPEVEPNDRCEQASVLPANGEVAGFLWPGDEDCFRLALPGVYRWASSLFDPVPREVIDAVRRRQGCDGG